MSVSVAVGVSVNVSVRDGSIVGVSVGVSVSVGTGTVFIPVHQIVEGVRLTFHQMLAHSGFETAEAQVVAPLSKNIPAAAASPSTKHTDICHS